jgi:soluble lytic murein transglycosylase-like protein
MGAGNSGSGRGGPLKGVDVLSRRILTCLAAIGAGAATPIWALDAAGCEAVRAAGPKFSLGVQACSSVPPEPVRRLPPAGRATQLHLFDAPVPPAALPEPEPPAPRPTSAPPAKPPARMSAPLARAVRLAPAVQQVAVAHALDPLLLHAIARVESRHDPQAVSHAGARGLMQVMPATGARFGVGDAQALHDAPVNLEVSARYLRFLKQRFGGELPLVLAAYNAGEGAVERHGRRIPPYAETRQYVQRVLEEYNRLQTAARAHR